MTGRQTSPFVPGVTIPWWLDEGDQPEPEGIGDLSEMDCSELLAAKVAAQQAVEDAMDALVACSNNWGDLAGLFCEAEGIAVGQASRARDAAQQAYDQCKLGALP